MMVGDAGLDPGATAHGLPALRLRGGSSHGQASLLTPPGLNGATCVSVVGMDFTRRM